MSLAVIYRVMLSAYIRVLRYLDFGSSQNTVLNRVGERTLRAHCVTKEVSDRWLENLFLMYREFPVGYIIVVSSSIFPSNSISASFEITAFGDALSNAAERSRNTTRTIVLSSICSLDYMF